MVVLVVVLRGDGSSVSCVSDGCSGGVGCSGGGVGSEGVGGGVEGWGL